MTMGGRVHPKYTPTTGLRLVSDEQMSIWDDHFPYTKMVRAKDSNKVGSGSHQPVVDSFFCNLAWNYPPAASNSHHQDRSMKHF